MSFQVLVFSRTKGYRHDSIPASITALQALANASENQPRPFSIHATEDPTVFSTPSLSQYRVIVFLQASGDFFDDKTQLDALKAFVHGGGGVVGVHCASNGMPSCEWYGRMIGGVFTEHPEPQLGTVIVEEPDHPITLGTLEGLGCCTTNGEETAEFQWFDEWYNFKENPRLRLGEKGKVLLRALEGSYTGGKLGDDHPIAWCHEFESARVYYTALGHFEGAYENEAFMRQILNAILWTGRVEG